MIKIWDLFAGTQSVKKAATKKYKIIKWEKWTGSFGKVTWYGYNEKDNQWKNQRLVKATIAYTGFDIYSPEDENTILDLTQDNIIVKLKSIIGNEIPDFIWASPVCNKFSKVITGKNGNFYFVLENGKLRPREKYETKGIQKHMLTRFNTNNTKDEANLALLMHNNTIKIINYFNTAFALENPATALSQHLYKKWIKNDTAYCMYGFDYKKPTAIYSNINLNLKKCNHKGMHKRVLTNTKSQRKNKTLSYAERSTVPPLLIKDILDKILDELIERNNNER